MEVSNVFKSQGVQKGDRMAIFMPPCPLAVASMLACASIIGAVYSIIRGGVSFPQKIAFISQTNQNLVAVSNLPF
jgi:acetyl-CoA synthetase